MKGIFVFIFCFLSYAKAEIDSSSFTNKDRFQMLNQEFINITDSLNLDITFIPPRRKKVNLASFVKTYEKLNGKWQLTELLELKNAFEEYDGNRLTHNLVLKKKNSEVAVEVDFIHCDYNGGQCDQERYLGQIKRKLGGSANKVRYELKIK